MWQPKNIRFTNLFSHANSEYNFQTGKCVVIFGHNDTDRNLENNGAGKTTLFEAICIALTNDSLRGLKKESFINRDAEECEIDFVLYNPVMKMSLRIYRKFCRGNKPVRVEIYENGKQNTQITSVLEANKRVLELIGISREDLLRYYIISQDNHYTFFTASDGEKKEIMNRITSADRINPVIANIGLRLKEIQAEFDDISGKIDESVMRRGIFEEQREEALVTVDNSAEIKEYEIKILATQKMIKGNEDDMAVLKKHIEDLLTQREAVKVPDVTKLKEKQKAIVSEIRRLENELSDSEKMRRKLQVELDSAVTCPECGAEFILKSDADLSPEEIRETMKSLQGIVKELKAELSQQEQQKKALSDKIDKAQGAQELLELIDDKLRNRRRKISVLKEENDVTLKKRIEKYEKEIENLKQDARDNALIAKLSTQIEECQKTEKELRKQIKPVEEELEMLKFWQFYMGKSGFQTYLANQSVKLIEGITNTYLRKFGVDISVLINGFKVLKSGEVREKIDVFVMNDGMNAEQFMAKSGGERGRITLAGILGIQHLINLSTQGRGLDLLLFDECFHGMDARGQENIIKIFEQMNITILVITQNVSESFNNENTLYVVKENGVSRYISTQSSK